MHFPRSTVPGTTLASENASKPLPKQAPKKLTGLGDVGRAESQGKCPQVNLESTVSQKFLADL